MKNYILFILISLLLISCRSGAQVPEDTVIKVMTPTPVPVDCKNEFYPSDAPQFGEGKRQGRIPGTPRGHRSHLQHY